MRKIFKNNFQYLCKILLQVVNLKLRNPKNYAFEQKSDFSLFPTMQTKVYYFLEITKEKSVKSLSVPKILIIVCFC